MVIDNSAHIGGVVIRLAISKSQFSVEDVLNELDRSVDRKTITNILAQLETDGWVEKNRSPFVNWKRGPLAHEYGNMTKFTQDLEGMIPVLPDERNI